MTEPRDQDQDQDEPDQDAEPTMTAPPEDRPDAGATAGGRADSPDVVDTDDAQDAPPRR
jgi:hypothetical protein